MTRRALMLGAVLAGLSLTSAGALTVSSTLSDLTEPMRATKADAKLTGGSGVSFSTIAVHDETNGSTTLLRERKRRPLAEAVASKGSAGPH